MSSLKLLSDNEPPAVSIYNAQAAETSSILILSDHASNRVPMVLDGLGLAGTSHLDEHIAVDIGAKDVTEYLADGLNAPAVMAEYSRLVIDLNRDLARVDSIPSLSDGIEVPGNKTLSTADKRARQDEIYHVYHDEITRQLACPAIKTVISVHSFTPVMNGRKRPTEIGILWDGVADFPRRLIKALRENNPDRVIGDNTPYSFIDDGELNHTFYKHDVQKMPNPLLVEFRQDLVDTPAKAASMSKIFLESLDALL